MATPILYNGYSPPQSIYEVSETPLVDVGTRGALSDGRVFYYARSSGAAIVAGNLLMAEIYDGDMDDLVVAASAAGQKVVSDVTPVGTKTWGKDDLVGGYCTVSDGPGEGINYRIAANPATTAATAFDLTLQDDIQVALTTASRVTLGKNPWMDTVIAAAAQAHFAVGVPNVAVPSGATDKQYFWCQTWGVVAGWDDAATAIGANITSGTTPGQFEINGTTDQYVGVQLFTGVATDYGPKFLTIAP